MHPSKGIRKMKGEGLFTRVRVPTLQHSYSNLRTQNLFDYGRLEFHSFLYSTNTH